MLERPIPARSSGHPHASARREPAGAGRRRTVPPPQRPRLPLGRRGVAVARSRTTTGSAWWHSMMPRCRRVQPSTSLTCCPSSWRTPPSSPRRTRWWRSSGTAPTRGTRCRSPDRASACRPNSSTRSTSCYGETTPPPVSRSTGPSGSSSSPGWLGASPSRSGSRRARPVASPRVREPSRGGPRRRPRGHRRARPEEGSAQDPPS